MKPYYSFHFSLSKSSRRASKVGQPHWAYEALGRPPAGDNSHHPRPPSTCSTRIQHPFLSAPPIFCVSPALRASQKISQPRDLLLLATPSLPLPRPASSPCPAPQTFSPAFISLRQHTARSRAHHPANRFSSQLTMTQDPPDHHRHRAKRSRRPPPTTNHQPSHADTLRRSCPAIPCSMSYTCPTNILQSLTHILFHHHPSSLPLLAAHRTDIPVNLCLTPLGYPLPRLPSAPPFLFLPR